MTQNTQGEFEITREQLEDYKGRHSQNVYVGNLPVGGYEGEVDLTNEIEQRARLFAAVPKLLEACVKLCLYLQELENAGYGKCEENPLYVVAMDAIAAAKGE